MKGFLVKLKNKGHLKFVEPSEEVSKSHVQKSESNLESARFLFEEKGKLEETVYLLYYSMYNLVLALLLRVGVKCENHAASIYLLEEIFGFDKSGIEKAKKERVEKQYYTDSGVSSEEFKKLLGIAEEFARNLRPFIEENRKFRRPKI